MGLFKSKFGEGLKKIGTGVAKNLDLIVPSLFSGGAGLGVLPGLMTGLSGRGIANVQAKKLEQDATEASADAAYKQAKLDQDARENELNRKNRLSAASISSSNRSTAAGEKITDADYLAAKKQYNTLLNQGMTDDVIQTRFPDLLDIMDTYEQLHNFEED